MAKSLEKCQSFLLPTQGYSDILRVHPGIMNIDGSAPVISHKHLGNYALLTLESPVIAEAAAPGQFLMIRTNDLTHPLLRRPFSLHNSDGKNIEIFYQVVGRGTALLSRKQPGDHLDILGPLGRGFSLSRSGQREAALIGGGRGIAPFFFLARELRSRGISSKIFYGGRSEEDLPLRERFEREGFPLICSSDDGSFGFRGLVTDLLVSHYGQTKPSRAYVCGPDGMMAAAASVMKPWGIPTEYSLESLMGCGFGACWGCVKRIRRNGQEEWRKICEDGPVFPGEKIIWDKNIND
jgi:dihydroorotate dehydrogenase electron transfer subunit